MKNNNLLNSNIKNGSVGIILFLIFNFSFNVSAQTVVQINPDSLTIITPGKNGVALPKTVKAKKTSVTKNRIAPVSSGNPTVIEIDHNNLEIITPGKNGLPLPQIYVIPDTGYIVQHGDTIYAPKTIIVKHPKPVLALSPRFRDNTTYNIQYLDVEQGLPYSNVYSTLEDKRGNFWFGTYGFGVTCYDGSFFTTFTIEEGFPHNTVRIIFEDKKGILWFGTGGGLVRYNGKTFTIFTEKEGLPNNKIRTILEDKNGILWFGTDGGLVSYDGKSFTIFTNEEGLISNLISSIIEDKNGNLWFATWGAIVHYDGTSFTQFTKKEGLVGNKVSSILEDKIGNIWVATWSGISRYDGKSFANFTKKEGLSSNKVLCAYEDKIGNLWFGTWGGVSRYDGSRIEALELCENASKEDLYGLKKENNKFIKTFTNFTQEDGLSNNIIFSISEDKSGNMWFGTLGGGINRYNKKSFTNFTKKEGLAESLIISISKDKKENLWLGTMDNGAIYYNGESFSNFTEKDGLVNNTVRSVLVAKNGNVWFGTRQGVSLYNGKTFTTFTQKEGLISNHIYDIYEAKNGNIWFGSLESGVSCYNGKSFSNFTEKDGLSHNNIYSILEDKNGNIWFGTGKGVSYYNGKSFTNFTEKDGFVDNLIWSILEDKYGNLWFGTDGKGVIFYDGKSFTPFSEKDGLSNNIACSIIEDNEENLWIGTDGGLNHFIFESNSHPNKNKTEALNKTKKRNPLYLPSRGYFNIEVFKKNDGLKSDFFMLNAVVNSNNQVWWGSGNTLSMLDLNKFQLPEKVPIVQLKGLYINSTFLNYQKLKDSLINEKFKKLNFSGVPDFYNYPLDLELPYSLNHLTFYFSAIDWAAPHKIEYQYKLEGLDENWSPLTKEGKAEYRNLPDGALIFKVRAIGAAHKWSETFEYEFTVLPPWWKTIRFYSLISIFILGTFLVLYRLRTKELEKDKTILKQTVKQRTTEIEYQKEEIQTQAEDLQKSLKVQDVLNQKFFAENLKVEFQNMEIKAKAEELKTINKKLIELNKFKEVMTEMIVHDLKNPLNGIINISNTYSFERQTTKMKQIGRQMLNMVLNILDVYKYEEAQMNIEKTSYSLLEISQNAIRDVAFLAEQKNISITNSISNKTGVKVEREVIERVFVNILTNGIKFTPNNGKISINGSKTINDFIRIEITDTGSGIPADQIHKIFDKFEQVCAKSSGKVRSTGIGLTFCRLVVDAHNGNIGVESEIGKGSTFHFTLPLAQLSEKDILLQEKQKTVKEEKISAMDLLTSDDKKTIEPFVLQLKEYEVYEISILRKLLNKIGHPKNKNIINWKEEVNQAIRNGNDEKYKELINLI